MNNIIQQAIQNGETSCPAGVNPIDWEMAKAQHAASQITGGTSLVETNNYTPPTTYQTSFSSNLDDVEPGFLDVDAYFKLANGQTKVVVKKEEKAVMHNEPFLAEINMSEINKKRTVKSSGVGGNVKYASTFDGLTSIDGRNWQTVLDEFGGSTPYVCYDISITLLQDIEGIEIDPATKAPKSVVILPKGTRIGHTTPTTGRNNFESLIKDIKQKFGTANQGIYTVKVYREDKHKEGGMKWAVLKFELAPNVE
jgi:hypothetical protein